MKSCVWICMQIAMDKTPTIAASLFRALTGKELWICLYSFQHDVKPGPQVWDAENAHPLQKASDGISISDHPFSCARPRLKVGVERKGYSPRVWSCLEGPCQKLVIAFAVPSAILRWCTHELSKLKMEVSVAGTSNWKTGISCVYFGSFPRYAGFKAGSKSCLKGDNVLENWRLGQRSSCHCGMCWSTTCKSKQEITVTGRKCSYVIGNMRRDEKVAGLEASQPFLSYSTEILL